MLNRIIEISQELEDDYKEQHLREAVAMIKVLAMDIKLEVNLEELIQTAESFVNELRWLR